MFLFHILLARGLRDFGDNLFLRDYWRIYWLRRRFPEKSGSFITSCSYSFSSARALSRFSHSQNSVIQCPSRTAVMGPGLLMGAQCNLAKSLNRTDGRSRLRGCTAGRNPIPVPEQPVGYQIRFLRVTVGTHHGKDVDRE